MVGDLSEMHFQTKALHFLNSNTSRGALETKAKRFPQTKAVSLLELNVSLLRIAF